MRAGRPNPQGLYLRVDDAAMVLEERRLSEGRDELIAVWKLADLQRRLAETHPASMWVRAEVVMRDGAEWFHYKSARFTGPPHLHRFSQLLEEGTVTVDHLIERAAGVVKEKGPLFKISPENLALLFPVSYSFDLLSYHE